MHHRCYETREQARREILEYIEIFYNCQGGTPGLGIVRPPYLPSSGPSTAGGMRLHHY
ncbi:MAG: hypothetical protein AMXMBFR7_52110 [Planctomycetota bacterium]